MKKKQQKIDSLILNAVYLKTNSPYLYAYYQRQE